MTPPVPSYPAPTPLPIPHRDPVRFEFTYPLQNSFGTVSLASDTAPTASSQKFLNSGAIYTALTGKISNPPSEGTAGQLLATDGSGGRYWTDAGTGTGTVTSVSVNGGTPVQPVSGNVGLTGMITTSEVVDNVTTQSATVPLSANQGYVLNDRIDNIATMGRFLSVWDCTTGKPVTEPTSTPYAYKTGDYYIVGIVGSANLKPSGTSYTGAASATAAESAVKVNDVYRYDGNSAWTLVSMSDRTVSWGTITGTLSNQTDLNASLQAKQDKLSWVSGRAYSQGDIVIYNGRVYMCWVANSDQSWTVSHWALLPIIIKSNGYFYDSIIVDEDDDGICTGFDIDCSLSNPGNWPEWMEVFKADGSNVIFGLTSDDEDAGHLVKMDGDAGTISFYWQHIGTGSQRTLNLISQVKLPSKSGTMAVTSDVTGDVTHAKSVSLGTTASKVTPDATTGDVDISSLIDKTKIVDDAAEIRADGGVYRPTGGTRTVALLQNTKFETNEETPVEVTPTPFYDYADGKWHLGVGGSCRVKSSDVSAAVGADVYKFESDAAISATTVSFSNTGLFGEYVFATATVATAATAARAGSVAVVPPINGNTSVPVGSIVKMGSDGVLAAAEENTDYIKTHQSLSDRALENPTFTEAATLATVNSGEACETMWGKVKKAISSLISHEDFLVQNTPVYSLWVHLPDLSIFAEFTYVGRFQYGSMVYFEYGYDEHTLLVSPNFDSFELDDTRLTVSSVTVDNPVTDTYQAVFTLDGGEIYINFFPPWLALNSNKLNNKTEAQLMTSIATTASNSSVSSLSSLFTSDNTSYNGSVMKISADADADTVKDYVDDAVGWIEDELEEV